MIVGETTVVVSTETRILVMMDTTQVQYMESSHHPCKFAFINALHVQVFHPSPLKYADLAFVSS